MQEKMHAKKDTILPLDPEWIKHWTGAGFAIFKEMQRPSNFWWIVPSDTIPGDPNCLQWKVWGESCWVHIRGERWFHVPQGATRMFAHIADQEVIHLLRPLSWLFGSPTLCRTLIALLQDVVHRADAKLKLSTQLSEILVPIVSLDDGIALFRGNGASEAAVFGTKHSEPTHEGMKKPVGREGDTIPIVVRILLVTRNDFPTTSNLFPLQGMNHEAKPAEFQKGGIRIATCGKKKKSRRWQ